MKTNIHSLFVLLFILGILSTPLIGATSSSTDKSLITTESKITESSRSDAPNPFDLKINSSELSSTELSNFFESPNEEIIVPDFTNFNKPLPITYPIAKEVLPYAKLALDSYSFRVHEQTGFIRAEKTDLPKELQEYYVSFSDPKKGKLLVDTYSGVQAAVWFSTDGKKVILGFAGTDLRVLGGNLPSIRFLANVNSYVWYYLGYDNLPFLDESLSIALSLKIHFPNKELIILGSSLSGAQAKYCAIATNSKAYTFNSLGLNGALHEKLAQDFPLAYARANTLITEVDLAGDVVTETLPYHFTKYPIGTTYNLPSPTPQLSNHLMDAVIKDLEHFITTNKPNISLRTKIISSTQESTELSDPYGVDYVL